MGRSIRLLVMAASLSAVLAACSYGPAPAGPPVVTTEAYECTAGRGVDALLVPECGVLLGTTDSPNDVVALSLLDQQQAVQAQRSENGAGAPDFAFELVRVYQRGHDGAIAALATQLERLDEAPDQLLYFSWKVDTGEGAWERVANGAFDAVLAEFGVAVSASGHTILVSLHHEPESDREGTPEEYVAMWRHAHGVVSDALGDDPGTGEVVWVMNYQGHVAGSDFEEVASYYPGSDLIDWLSYNPYNWAVCRPGAEWRSFLDVATPMYSYLTSEPLYANGDGETKPILIGETATNEDPENPARKAQWLRDMAATLEGGKLPQIKAVVYFNQAAPAFCDRYWASSAASTEAFVDLATSPFFNPITVEGD